MIPIFYIGLSLNKGEISNFKMEVCDQLPDFDRVDLPISRVSEIIPSMCMVLNSVISLINI